MGEGARCGSIVDLDFPTYLAKSGDFQSVILVSLPIYISEFQRYPELSHKAKNLIPSRARLLGIYCLNFSLPLCVKSSSSMLMNCEVV